MKRRVLENVFFVTTVLVVLGLFGGAAWLVMSWDPSMPKSPATIDADVLRDVRCAGRPSERITMRRTDALALSEGDALSASVRASPLVAGDPPAQRGYRLLSVAAGSLYARVGLCAGDVVTTVAGVPLVASAALLEVYERAREAPEVRIDLVRSGGSASITVTLE
jgi:hypothetical protein